MTRLERSARSSVAVRWLRRRMVVAFALCPVVTFVITLMGPGHRVPAIVLMFTVVLGTHVYVIVCAAWALLLVPTNRSGAIGPLWDDTPIVGLLALPVVIALARFTDEPTGTAGMATVGVILAAMLIRGYRNGFQPPEPNDQRDEPEQG